MSVVIKFPCPEKPPEVSLKLDFWLDGKMQLQINGVDFGDYLARIGDEKGRKTFINMLRDTAQVVEQGML